LKTLGYNVLTPMTITIDSSVWVASFVPQERLHNDALKIMDEARRGTSETVIPVIVLVEVSAALLRKTGNAAYADEAVRLMLEVPNIDLVDVDYSFALEAMEFNKHASLKGMDTIIVYTALRYGAMLVTFDEELKRRAASFVAIR